MIATVCLDGTHIPASVVRIMFVQPAKMGRHPDYSEDNWPSQVVITTRDGTTFRGRPQPEAEALAELERLIEENLK